MRPERTTRIAHVLAGVLRQAAHDAGATRALVIGTGRDADFVRDLVRRALGTDALGDGGLVLHPASKTVLLLAGAPVADVLPFGDLYYSQVCELTGDAGLPASVGEIAVACGGPAALDEALARLFERRLPPAASFADLATPARERLAAALDAARFRRARTGMVPKLGSRTLGIDLYA